MFLQPLDRSDSEILILRQKIQPLLEVYLPRTYRHEIHVPLFDYTPDFPHIHLARIPYGYLDSIEGAYIGLARWILEHPFDWSWFPLWYNGIPFQDTYPPLLHFLVALAAGLSGASPALSYHAVTALLYCLGPVTLFWFACRLSGERWTSFYAALFYSVVSPAALLVPEIAADMGSAFGARRLHALVRYGEGPHIAAMTLLPVALMALDRATHRWQRVSDTWMLAVARRP